MYDPIVHADYIDDPNLGYKTDTKNSFFISLNSILFSTQSKFREPEQLRKDSVEELKKSVNYRSLLQHSIWTKML